MSSVCMLTDITEPTLLIRMLYFVRPAVNRPKTTLTNHSFVCLPVTPAASNHGVGAWVFYSNSLTADCKPKSDTGFCSYYLNGIFKQL